MINEKAQEHILSAIEKEKEEAILNYGYFHSDHEFWAVLKEEVEELQEESIFCSKRIDEMWDTIRNSDLLYMMQDEEKRKRTIKTLKNSAINAACEAVQVAAVIDKYLEGESKKVKCEKCGGGMRVVFSQKDGKHTMAAICPYCGHYAVLNERSEDEIMQMEE